MPDPVGLHLIIHISFWWALRSWTQFSFFIGPHLQCKVIASRYKEFYVRVQIDGNNLICLTLEQLDGPELSKPVYMVLLVSGAGGKTLLRLPVYIQGHGWLKAIVIPSTCLNVTCYMTGIVTYGFAVNSTPFCCVTLGDIRLTPLKRRCQMRMSLPLTVLLPRNKLQINDKCFIEV